MRFSDHVSVSNNSLIFVSLEHCSLEFKLELLAFSSGPESFLLLLPPRLPTVPNPKTFGCLQEEAGMRLQSRIQRSSAPVFFSFSFWGFESYIAAFLHWSFCCCYCCTLTRGERETHTWPQQRALCPVCCWCTWYLSSVLVHLDPSQAVVVVVGFRSREREREVCTKYYISYCEIQE